MSEAIPVAHQHKDGSGFNIILQAFPLDGKIVCREITAEEEATEPAPSIRPKHYNTGRGAPNAQRR